MSIWMNERVFYDIWCNNISASAPPPRWVNAVGKRERVNASACCGEKELPPKGKAFITWKAGNCAVPLCLLPSSAWWRVQTVSFIHRWWLNSRATYHPLTKLTDPYKDRVPKWKRRRKNRPHSYERVTIASRTQKYPAHSSSRCWHFNKHIQLFFFSFILKFHDERVQSKVQF